MWGAGPVQQHEEEAFLDLLYGAPFDASLWVPAMEKFADLMNCNGAWLSRLSVADGTGTGIIARIDPEKPAVYLAHFASINPFSNEADPCGYVARWSPRIRFYEDWLTRDEVERTEYYNEFLRPQDIYCSMMMGLSADGVETSTLNMNRSHSKGDFGEQEIETAYRFHSHWRRAFRLAGRLHSAGTIPADLAAMLDHGGRAMLLVESGGRVRYANTLAERMLGGRAGLGIEAGRLLASHPPAARQLEALIGQATRADGFARRGGSMLVPNADASGWLAVSVDPVPDQPTDIFRSTRAAILCVTDPQARANVSESRMQQMFGLTPAEARVARALMEGASPREAADKLGVRYQTARNQIQALMQKTGTSRQVELVLLLARVTAPEPQAPSSLSVR